MGFAFTNHTILMINAYLVTEHVPGTVVTVLHVSHRPFNSP